MYVWCAADESNIRVCCHQMMEVELIRILRIHRMGLVIGHHHCPGEINCNSKSYSDNHLI